MAEGEAQPPEVAKEWTWEVIALDWCLEREKPLKEERAAAACWHRDGDLAEMVQAPDETWMLRRVAEEYCQQRSLTVQS